MVIVFHKDKYELVPVTSSFFKECLGIDYIDHIVFDASGSLSRTGLSILVKKAYDLGHMYEEQYWFSKYFKSYMENPHTDDVLLLMDKDILGNMSVYAVNDIRAGSFLGCFVGEVIYRPMVLLQWFRPRELFHYDIGNYINKFALDATNKGNHVRWFTNGKHHVNAKAIGCVDSSYTYHIVIYAIEDIPAGAPIRLRYQ